MTEKTDETTPEKKEILDDNARKFIIENFDADSFNKNAATSFILSVDWLEIGEGTEKKVAHKRFDNGEVQILLISKVTIDGHRTAEKYAITQQEYEELIGNSIMHLHKQRSECNYMQDGTTYAIKVDEFTGGKLCMLEVEAASEKARNNFDASKFPFKLREVTGDLQYYGYRMTELV